MNCHCCSGECKKSGKYKNRNRIVQRFYCVRCGKSFSEEQPMGGVRIDFDQTVNVVHLLSESMGIRAISRFTGLNPETVLNVLETAGEHCARLLDVKLRNIKVPHVECDEVYSYCQKQPDGTQETGNDSERGDVWTFLSIAHYEKLIINFRVSKRTGYDAAEFLTDLRGRMSERFQLTTDSFRGYVSYHSTSGNVEDVLGDCCDYSTETKKIEKDYSLGNTRHSQYFAPRKVSVKRHYKWGNPDMSIATTNHAERTNLTLRTLCRRFTRRTLNFSKTLANHRNAVALFVATFNFCRTHKTLGGKTPAMAAGLTDHVWTIKELLAETI